MSDAKIDIQESSSPTHSVDGEAVVNDAGLTVFRQKVDAPEAGQLLAEIRTSLQALLSLAPAKEPVNASARVTVQGTVPVSGSLTALTTVTTVTTVATVTNMAQIGGFLAAADQYGHGAGHAAALIQRTVVLWQRSTPRALA